MEQIDRFAEVVKFILEYSEKNGYSPNVRELGEPMGLTSPATIHKVVKRMKSAGYINIQPRIARSVMVLPKGFDLVSK